MVIGILWAIYILGWLTSLFIMFCFTNDYAFIHIYSYEDNEIVFNVCTIVNLVISILTAFVWPFLTYNLYKAYKYIKLYDKHTSDEMREMGY